MAVKVKAKEMQGFIAAWRRAHKAAGGCAACAQPQFPTRKLWRVAQGAMSWAISISLNEQGYTMSEDGWMPHDFDFETAKSLVEEVTEFMHVHGEPLIPWAADTDPRNIANVGIEFQSARSGDLPGKEFALTRWGNGNPFIEPMAEEDVVIVRLDEEVRARLTEAACAYGAYRVVARDGALYREVPAQVL